MSLWTMLRLCRYFRAPARLYTMTVASLSVYLAKEVIASNKSPPCAIISSRGMRHQTSQTKLGLCIYCIMPPYKPLRTLTSSITRYSSEEVSTSSINMMMLGCFTFRSTATSFSMRCSWKRSKTNTRGEHVTVSPDIHDVHTEPLCQ